MTKKHSHLSWYLERFTRLPQESLLHHSSLFLLLVKCSTPLKRNARFFSVPRSFSTVLPFTTREKKNMWRTDQGHVLRHCYPGPFFLIFDIVDQLTKAVIFHNQMIKIIRIMIIISEKYRIFKQLHRLVIFVQYVSRLKVQLNLLFLKK